MVFNILPTLWILMLENEVHLVCSTTLIRTKHDRIWRFVIKFLWFPSALLGSKIFNICATTFEAILKASLKLKNNCSILKTDRLGKFFDYSIFPGLFTNKKSIIIMPITLGMLPDTQNPNYKSKYIKTRQIIIYQTVYFIVSNMHPKTKERDKNEASREENICNPILRTAWSGTTIQDSKNINKLRIF